MPEEHRELTQPEIELIDELTLVLDPKRSRAHARDAREVDLAKDFHRDMIWLYQRAKTEAAYNATRFIEMVSTLGGVQTARLLLASPTVSEGFAALWERGRLDLSVESR